jgi:uncharacterized protein YcbK (DUF882 family)
MVIGDWGKVNHFHPAEFTTREPGNLHEPAADKMGYEFMLWLDKVREKAGHAMRVTSCYRSPAHNVEVGGAQDSAHEDVPCNAVDVQPFLTPDDPHGNRARFAIVSAAMALGCTRIGIYPDGSVHLDRTEEHRPALVLWTKVDNPAH